MHTFLIIGKSFKTLREYILNNGDEYVTLADKNTVKNPEKRLKRRVVCDFSSESKILKSLELAKKKYQIDAVISTYENYILPASLISDSLGLPGLPLPAALACTDKSKMRDLFNNSGDNISPDFKIVNDFSDILSFSNNHAFPLILKPANLAKSLLVTKNDDLSQIELNYQKTMRSINDVYKKYAPNKKPKLIVEEFLNGPIFSVDAFVDETGDPFVLDQVVDYQTGHDIGYDDNFHYSRIVPSKLNKKQIESIRKTASLGCKALGMKSSPAHIEIILTKKGPKIVEIGARNGGYRERMHNLANNIDITGNSLNIALGKKPDIKSTKNEPCAVLELFPKQPGEFLGIENSEKLKKLKSLNYFSVKVSLGDFVGKSADGYKMCAVIILHNNDLRQFSEDLDFVNQNVKVKTRVKKL